MINIARPNLRKRIGIKTIKDMAEETMHPYVRAAHPRNIKYNKKEVTAGYWDDLSKDFIRKKLKESPNTGIAKNVILFIGDGMSLQTLTAARAYLSRKQNLPGEENLLSFENLPYVGLSKTYCIDRQVADSACTATAYLCGIKNNFQTIGVTGAVRSKDCRAMANVSNHVFSIARWSQQKGKRTGIVPTTRITDASPAGAYAHTAYRKWETDSSVMNDGVDPTVCHDIAYQLIHGITGKELNVIFGGGRRNFLPHYRYDKRNLIQEWLAQKSAISRYYKYVKNRKQLMKASNDTEYLMGLFSTSSMDYNLDRSHKIQPSLTEMTRKAIQLLSKGDNGFFLFVEGGRIDHGHHQAMAQRALDETIEFHKAVEAALKMTNSKDTLIVVTADHSHTMSLSGYPFRGNDILKFSGIGSDRLPYSTLSYANGPGYKIGKDGRRYDISKDNLVDKNYQYPGLAPLRSETHAADDVGVYAQGPWAHLLTGVMEQTVIPHVMAFASCVNNDENACSVRQKHD